MSVGHPGATPAVDPCFIEAPDPSGPGGGCRAAESTSYSGATGVVAVLMGHARVRRAGRDRGDTRGAAAWSPRAGRC